MTNREYNNCVDLYSDAVYRFILKNLGDTEMARDVVQDAFMKMWEKRLNVDGEKAKSYLFTAAYRTMIDKIRKEKRTSSLETTLIIEKEGFVPGEFDVKSVIRDALKKIPEIQRSCVMLRDYEGYSYKEIGDILKLNESQVKVYIYRARVSLKEYIKDINLVL